MRKQMRNLMFATFAAFGMAFLSGCSKAEEQGSVYYLNFKPEVADIWEELADIYTDLTGVEVKILTATGGIYERTLQAEIAKREAPTLFQINGPVAYQTWQNYCLDLKDTELYSWMSDPTLAVTKGEGVYAIPYVVEGYGIIYNEEITERYFSLPDKAVSISSMDEVNNFELLKQVVEDMTAHKKELGIEGVFASTSFASGENWRWHTHLANLPIYYEFRDKGISDTDVIDFTYEPYFKNILDLYVSNSITDKMSLSNKTIMDSMTEFAQGKVAMVQNGNWAWAQISSIEGNTVLEDNIKFLPIYMGVPGEESQGLCIGTENFLAVNTLVSEKDQQATIAFLEWIFSSDIGKHYITNEFGFITPFRTFTEEEVPADPLAKEVIKSMDNPDRTSVNWNFNAFPGPIFKEHFGSAILSYVEGDMTWEDVVSCMKEEWYKRKLEFK